MNSLIQLNKTTWLFCIALLLACFGPSPGVQATDLDGVLPGGNNADGFRVLTNLTTGGFNTGAGWFSLFSDQSGSFNTAFGAATLFSNTADQNTATGAAALFSNTAGSFNTATGAFALFSNTMGGDNAATGDDALFHNTIGSNNTANGPGALLLNTTGSFNTGIGDGALGNNATGGFNTGLGAGAGSFQTTGSNSIYIGDSGGAGESNVIAIGNLASSGVAYEQFFVGAVYGVTTTSGITLPVLVSDTGQLGTMSSSRRFKKEIKPMDKVSESILALKPVTFHYKSDTKSTPQFGLVAEEVASVSPDLVVRDKNGDIYSVRYDAVNAMLLNEFLKAHRKIEDQEATITELISTAAQQQKDFQATAAHQQKQIDALSAGLEKVNAELAAASPSRGGLELTKRAPQIVLNNR